MGDRLVGAEFLAGTSQVWALTLTIRVQRLQVAFRKIPACLIASLPFWLVSASSDSEAGDHERNYEVGQDLYCLLGCESKDV